MSSKVIKQRIRSVKNTAQITKAMEMVSAAKMRRSQESALRTRPYARHALKLLRNLTRHSDVLPTLFAEKKTGPTVFLLISSDKGLAGSLNANIFRLFERERKNLSGGTAAVMVVGKKAREYAERQKIPVLEFYVGYGDTPTVAETLRVTERALRGFLEDGWREVRVVYTAFRTTLLQEALCRPLLPLTEGALEEVVAGILPERGRYAASKPGNSFSSTDKIFEYQFEPSPEAVLEPLTRELAAVFIYHAILEANASEHSARMVAMKNASENARELIGTLTLTYNKARQAGITREIIEITSGAEVLQT